MFQINALKCLMNTKYKSDSWSSSGPFFIALCTRANTHTHTKQNKPFLQLHGPFGQTQWTFDGKHTLCYFSEASVITCTSTERESLFSFKALYIDPCIISSAAIRFLCIRTALVQHVVCVMQPCLPLYKCQSKQLCRSIVR